MALSACGSSKEQLDLKEALLSKLKDDSDLKDYKLDPSDIADCIVDEITDSLPGIVGDPRRPRFLEAYAKFIAVKSPSDAEMAAETYKDLFGSAQQAREAGLGVTDYIMSCIGAAVEKRDAQ
jgi:hypothetical protein